MLVTSRLVLVMADPARAADETLVVATVATTGMQVMQVPAADPEATEARRTRIEEQQTKLKAAAAAAGSSGVGALDHATEIVDATGRETGTGARTKTGARTGARARIGIEIGARARIGIEIGTGIGIVGGDTGIVTVTVTEIEVETVAINGTALLPSTKRKGALVPPMSSRSVRELFVSSILLHGILVRCLGETIFIVTVRIQVQCNEHFIIVYFYYSSAVLYGFICFFLYTSIL